MHQARQLSLRWLAPWRVRSCKGPDKSLAVRPTSSCAALQHVCLSTGSEAGPEKKAQGFLERLGLGKAVDVDQE